MFAIAALAMIPVQYFILEKVLERPPGQSIAEVNEAVLAAVDSPHEPYSSIPPTSGPHVKDGAPWGMHTEPIPNEVQVANLAAGGVIIQYNCVRGTDECEEVVRRLEQLYAGRYAGRTVLIAPGPAVADARIALTAWTRLLKLASYRESAVTEFADAFLKKPSKS